MAQELIHEQAAAYALDALDDSERREFEEHLASCEQCTDELEGLQAAAAALAYVSEEPAPPPALRERLLERVHAEHAPAAPASNVVPLRRRFALPAATTFGVAAAAAAIVLAVWASSLSSSLDRKSAITRILANPASTRIQMGTRSQVVVAPGGNAVLVSSLGRAPAGHTYEIWVIRGGSKLPAGLFSDGTSTAPVLLGRTVPKGAQIGVSIERSGGANQPTHIVDVSTPI